MEIYCFYEQAIRELAPGANWCLFNNSLEGIEWRTPEIEQPTNEEIEEKAQELLDAYLENPPEPQDPPTPFV